jgi:glycosyltransferase involved in cell wall biosynthesis
MRDTILYIGGFRLPDVTASAQRATENANLFRQLGFRVVLAGKLDPQRDGIDNHQLWRMDIDGNEAFDIRHPGDGQFRSYEQYVDSIERICHLIGSERIAAIVAYNYPTVALWKMIRFARSQSIVPVAECTERYGWEGAGVLRNIRRIFYSELRVRYLARYTKNVICASSFGCRLYSHCNTLRLPFVVDTTAAKWSSTKRSDSRDHKSFVYAGSPGMKMSKDSLDVVVEAMSLVSAKRSLTFRVVGMDRAQFLTQSPHSAEYVQQLGTSIEFLGRLSHLGTIECVKNADFFVFLRPQNRTSQFGFPTKLVEAFCCGTPVITNRTSDIGDYIQDDVNGYLVAGNDGRVFSSVIERAVGLASGRHSEMKRHCRENNPFRTEAFVSEAKRFFDELR